MTADVRALPLPLPASIERFLSADHICTLTTLRPDGSPHVVPVRFTWDTDSGLARVMTVGWRRKARNLVANPGSRAAVCQAVGPRWVTLEGAATVSADPARVAEGRRRYRVRYGHAPPPVAGMVVIEIAVDRVLGLD